MKEGQLRQNDWGKLSVDFVTELSMERVQVSGNKGPSWDQDGVTKLTRSLTVHHFRKKIEEGVILSGGKR